MSEISELILLLNKQHQEQMAVLRDEHREQNKQYQEQNNQHQEQMAVLRDEHREQNKQHQEQMSMLQEQLKILQSSLNNPRENVSTPMASFQPFDSTSELWTDYLARFRTFVTANSIPDNKQAQIFLTNQSNSVYKMLSNLAAQQQPVKSIHELTMNDIQTFMAEQFDPKRFVVRERFKFWSDMKRKPGETIPELASRIRQDAATCDFQSIKDPLDEALRTKFICSVDNEAVLKTLFKLKDDELKFSNAIKVAQEVEEAAKVAKETVHGHPSFTNRSQKKLALSTHKGVLLQKRLPFGIKSAPGYFQEIMEQLTQNLRGVAVYFDDILVSGDNAKDHLMNLRALFKRLEEKGLRCNREKCVFAQVSIDYLGHTLSSRGIAKGSKVDAILEMPTPKNISTLKSFLASVQFYSKFLPPYFSEITEPLYKLTRKGQQWKWGEEEATSFKEIKRLLCTETVLAHYDPSLPLGLSCDASECGIGAVLFHRFADGSEHPILNISKILSATQRRYSQIQKEALSLVYALKKFHQFLYGRKFIVVTDHKPLVTLFAPDKGTPAMAANRLARWALLVHQYDYTVEYRRSKDHGNADALSRLPFSNDTSFDGEEMEDDVDIEQSVVKSILTIHCLWSERLPRIQFFPN